ncbi:MULTISPECIES: acyl-CoA dehydratase activase-related protein [unclassified Halanaerobium]|uniref:acyl-CoA dehydratase activase-related protein n=1 Tax=unclassified Halanaerobium TaxID=2641197 RepID=UPI000DF17649
MKVGLPAALLYYYYFPFWFKLFDELNIELVVSDNTSRKLLDKGTKNAISEICVPIKIMVGHILNLKEKEVDYIYLPRFKSLKKGTVMCPKFLGLPDLIKHTFPEFKNIIISDIIKSKSDNISQYHNFINLKEKLNRSKFDMKSALKKSALFWERFRELLFSGYLIDDFLKANNIKSLEKIIADLEQSSLLPQSKQQESFGREEFIDIALIGYVYNVYDSYINMDIIKKCKELGVRVHTFSMVKEEIIESELKKLRKPMFWEFTNKLYGACEYYLKNKRIDGIIHLTAFGCGPDSVLSQILEFDAKNYNKPFMTLRIDEQTGESHIITRIEAFVDLLRLKKEEC